MKRLIVGFAALCLLTVTVGMTGASPVDAAGVPGFTNVTTVNAFSYADGHLFGGTFCVNGAFVSNAETEQSAGPFSLASGSADVTFFDTDTTCDSANPNAEATVVFPDQGSVTLMAYWSGDQTVVMLADPLQCVDAGMGRLTVRNGQNSRGGSVDIYGTGPGGVSTLLLSDVHAGSEGSIDLPVGNYTDLFAAEVGSTDPLTAIDDISIVADSGAYAYLYGGNDGAQGSFLGDPAGLQACAVATTTTTAPPAAAPAVEAQPAFTG